MLVTACGGDPTTTPDITVDSTVTVRENIRPDSTEGWLYYSLESGDLVSAEQAETQAWDIRLPYIQCCGKTKAIPIQLNSGPNGLGSVKGAVVSGRFESISKVPYGMALREDDTVNPVVPLSVLGSNVFFVYDIATHTLRTSADKVIILETSSGRVWKFQITSIYKDAIANPNQESPIGFYHFRSAQIGK
jgi:hypothetical protein